MFQLIKRTLFLCSFCFSTSFWPYFSENWI